VRDRDESCEQRFGEKKKEHRVASKALGNSKEEKKGKILLFHAGGGRWRDDNSSRSALESSRKVLEGAQKKRVIRAHSGRS